MSKKYRCGHCTAVGDENNYAVHDKTCPHGKAIEKITASDAAWFESNPGKTFYIRPVVQVEMVDVMNSLGVENPESVTYHGDVFVRQIKPGVRTRQFYGVFATIGDNTIVQFDDLI